MFTINIEILKKLKYYIFKKTLSLFIVDSQCDHGYEKILKQKNQLKY